MIQRITNDYFLRESHCDKLKMRSRRMIRNSSGYSVAAAAAATRGTAAAAAAPHCGCKMAP